MNDVNSLLGQHVMIGLQGPTLLPEEKKFIIENEICGVTLFGRNAKEPQQIYELCKELHSLTPQTKNKVPLFVAIDMEGGRVARLKAPFTVWPALSKLGDIDSPTLSFHFAQAMGKELRAVGINLDFAPCADVLTHTENPAIGDRSLSSDPEIVAKHVSALIRGYMKSEVIPCVKHFPGHGNTKVDSHHDLPVESTDLDTLRNRELLPFKKALKSKIEMVMSSHIRFQNIDSEWPCTLSEKFLTDLLRQELKFQGLIITDDLGMKAMTSFFPQEKIPVRALQAGANILLYCNDFDVPPMALESLKSALSAGDLNSDSLQNSYKKIVEMKKNNIKSIHMLSYNEVRNIVGHPDHQKLSQAIAEGKVPPELVSANI